MEKIDNLKNRLNFKSPGKKKKTEFNHIEKKKFAKTIKPLVENNETGFDFKDNNENKETLSRLLDEVYAKGEKLKGSPTLENIKDYRWSVKKLLKDITEKMLKLEEKISGVNILKRKRFTLIKVIDTKLESLAAEVLRAQKEQLRILSKVDEINGLLVDLLS
ncbi:MAG: YaaR family protein [Spirochaetales bacterium]|nr:YaaR family protein [Spirochaetales bacterium]